MSKQMCTLVFLCLFGLSCDDAPEFAAEGGEASQSTAGLAEALAACPPDEPCPIVAYAHASCLDLTPLDPDVPLGVFDAQQGGVATWLTMVIGNAPEEHPFVQLEMITDDGPINFNADKGPKALKVPFLPLDNEGTRYQDQYMVPFNTVCCADLYEGATGTLKITVSYPDRDPVTAEFPFSLKEDPWPLDNDNMLLEQCTCDAWPGERDDSLCEEEPSPEE
jgi:hypothetical protein